MKVTVTEKCGRCKREAPKQVEHTEVAQYAEADAQREEALKGVSNMLMQANEEAGVNMPDLVVYFKGEVKGISQVCDAHCKSPVENALKSVFKEIDPSKRKPRKKKDTPDPATAPPPPPKDKKGDKKDEKPKKK